MFIKKGKKSRNQLRLPVLHYVVADQWIDVLGPIAFTAWLKLHTWVDRRDELRAHDKVPYTLDDTAKKLEMSKAKLYRTVIVPLWEHELIDLVEYDSARKAQKPKNIIVYESPRNEHLTEIQPLVKTRDWKKDYGSDSQIHGRKGGRPKGKRKINFSAVYRFKNKTVRLHGFKNETVYGFKNKTVTVSKLKPNNVFNNLITNTNKPNNYTNKQQEDKKTVVVSANNQNLINSKWEELFSESINSARIVTLSELAMEGMKTKQIDVDDPKEQETVERILYVMEQMKIHSYPFKTNAFTAISHALKNGYTWTTNKSNEMIPAALLSNKEVAATTETKTNDDDIEDLLAQWAAAKKKAKVNGINRF